MTTLTIVAENSEISKSSALKGYVRDVTRSIVATSPRSCTAEILLSKNSELEQKYYYSACPQANQLKKNVSTKRLVQYWSNGLFCNNNDSLLHSPTILAPLRKKGYSDTGQITVTIHTTAPYRYSENFSSTSVRLYKKMIKRAYKHADAVVVPSHAVAENINSIHNFGSRIRVIGTGSPTAIVNASTQEFTPANSGLSKDKDSNVIIDLDTAPISYFTPIIESLKFSSTNKINLLVLSDAHDNDTILKFCSEHSLDLSRVVPLARATGSQKRDAYIHSSAHIIPSFGDRYPDSALTALALEVPIIHHSSPVLNEIIGDSGIMLEAGTNVSQQTEQYAEVISVLLGDKNKQSYLSTLGSDRSKAFSWRSTGEKIWQLHADL